MSSSPIYRVVDQFDPDDLISVPTAPAALLTALRTVPNPRQRQELRHELDGILAVAACAVVAGSRSFPGGHAAATISASPMLANWIRSRTG
jgi:hypothetical protein